jgi:hypothetical protein
MIFNLEVIFSLKNLIARFLFLPFAFCLLPSLAAAHTFHTSLTRMDYNADEKIVEITIQVFAHDLETAIEKRAGKRVNLEKSPDATKFILDYLNERFALKNKNGETQKLAWVGKEQSADSVWLYVEAKSPEGLENASLENRLFFELHKDQVNLVTCRDAGKKQDFAFKPGGGAKKITLSAKR